jgi:hypothetical protein
MKYVSPAVQVLLQSGDIMYYHLVKIGPFRDFNGNLQTWRHTQVPGGISIDGEYFTDDNTLMHIDPPRQSAAVDRESFKIAYSDNGFDLRPYFEGNFSGIPVEIYIGFYNTSDQVLSGVAPGMPLNTRSDLMMVYAGNTDAPSYNIDTRSEVIVTIECTSPMGALQMIRTLNTNKESLQLRNPNDTAYDELYVGSKGLTLLWGKRT